MLDEMNNWVFSSRLRRRMLFKAWRLFLRVQRATLANAVLVVRRQNGCVLALPSLSGEPRLPLMELDGWQAVTTQIEEWLVPSIATNFGVCLCCSSCSRRAGGCDGSAGVNLKAA